MGELTPSQGESEDHDLYLSISLPPQWAHTEAKATYQRAVTIERLSCFLTKKPPFIEIKFGWG